MGQIPKPWLVREEAERIHADILIILLPDCGVILAMQRRPILAAISCPPSALDFGAVNVIIGQSAGC